MKERISVNELNLPPHLSLRMLVLEMILDEDVVSLEVIKEFHRNCENVIYFLNNRKIGGKSRNDNRRLRG